MKKTLLLLLSFFFLVGIPLQAQETFPTNGVNDYREGLYVFTNATIHKSHKEKVENGTMIIKNGKIVAIGTRIPVPNGAISIDLQGKHIYPSFIDLHANYGMPEVKRGERTRGRRQMLSKKDGAYMWNQALKPEMRAHEHFKVNDRSAKSLRTQGFGTVLTHQMDGISRGTSTLVHLGSDREHEMIIKEQGAHQLSFSKGSSTQTYPSSLMGSIALIRQTYLDAAWYKTQQEEINISLEAWNTIQELPQIFEVRDRLDVLRAAKLAKEFNQSYIIKGTGDEYQRLDEIKAANVSMIIPLSFPNAYDVEDPYDAMQVTLAQMKHWELAPSNASRLAKANINFALTSYGLGKGSSFLSALQTAIDNGLDATSALKALTEVPALMIGAFDVIGSLDNGKFANFLITNGPIFAKDTKIYENWIKGKPYIIKASEEAWQTGSYSLKVGDKSYQLDVTGNANKPKMKIVVDDTTSLDVKYSSTSGVTSLSFPSEKGGKKIRLSGVTQGKSWKGNGEDENGKWVNWAANFEKEIAPDSKKGRKEKGRRGNRAGKKEKTADETIASITYPFTAFGWTEAPQQANLLIKNATVWTNEADGIQENTDVRIQNGKIAEVGKNLSANGATVIDAAGKHLTPGIIDEHTHIAGTRGINEGSQASSAEVRIGDVINSEDINIYRQLAGGVTTAQVLHGSANPIGGQSAIIKMRWGYAPEKLKFENADGFIKFALGENVKQGNRGNDYRSRFPQTRMGVEQVFVDHFTRAQEYGKLVRSGEPYRRDLEMEALLEIIERKRFISCHSYVQSEINMLMKVAEQFNFNVNTFTHILEGYKVADKMAKHGAGGSSFSDWWAYKFEVYEAIPYNGALMHEQGVTVAFNSDDAEMARRLNQEAAKAVLFGGVSEEDALKFVTLNPAKLLHLEDRVGSIKAGKDADIVIWSDHPLSVYAKADMTFVDGIKFFDRTEDLKARAKVQAERNRLIQKMLGEKKRGAKMQRPRGRRQYQHYHCDDEEDEGY